MAAAPDPDPPRLFFCCGQHGSGSTWLFNLVREICRAERLDFVSCHRESAARLPRDGLGSRLLVVKSHNPMPDLRALIAGSAAPAVITVRDPRDAVVSYMQRFPHSLAIGFDEALEAIEYSAQALLALSRLRDMPVFRYEDGFIGRAATFDRIAALLGTRPTGERRADILAGLAPDAVRRTISSLEAAGAIRGEAVWDPETQWHANHVGDGKVGKFSRLLSLQQQREVIRRTAEFCRRFGYDAAADTTPADTTPADATPVDGAPGVAAAAGLAEPEPATPTRQAGADPGGIGPGSIGPRTIGLCMIARNEAGVIRQCLTSALPLVDYVLVVDTGSADGTQQVIRDFLAEHGVRGAVIDEPWRDFAYNRSFALARLRAVADIDYAMIIDADDLVVTDAGFDPLAFKTLMRHDLYDVEIRHGGVAFCRPQICRNRLAFTFRGVLHEFLEPPPGELSRTTAHGLRIQTGRSGARNQNPRKYQDDAALLERARATEPDPFLVARYTFYLAQSYRDCGERERALENYLRRAGLGYWSEEIFVSLLEAGNLMAALNRPFDEVVATYERASRTAPARAEALHAASLYCRTQGRNVEGREFARRGLGLTPPVGGLFVQTWVYDYGILDEFAINAYWSGAYRESLAASLKLLAGEKLPAAMIKRVADNASFAAERLPRDTPPELGPFGAESLTDQHRLVPPRALHTRLERPPRVLVAILAKQKAAALPLYLDCIEALDYPTSAIVLHIRTNNNTDDTERILRDWVARVGHRYAAVEFDATDVAEPVQQFGVHEWNATRFRVLGRIRGFSLHRARACGCAFYFVADVDNFIRPCTLRELVALDLPIVAPLLRSIAPGRFYANFHADIDANGYHKACDQYDWILHRWIRGVQEVPVVHCTYLVRTDVPGLSYEDATGRHEYVVFCDSARRAGVPQYIDNRQVYGYVSFADGAMHVAGGIAQARALLDADLRARMAATAGADADAAAVPERGANAARRDGSAPAAAASPPATGEPPMAIDVINLDRSPDRFAGFISRNAHLRGARRFRAVDGRQVARADLARQGLLRGAPAYSPGAIGNFLSHTALWQAAVRTGEVVTVAEDDAVVARDFEACAGSLLASAGADWDVVFWGWNFDAYLWVDLLPGISPAVVQTFQDRMRNGIAGFQDQRLPRRLVRLLHQFGTACYSVTPNGARRMLEFCLPLRPMLTSWRGFDVKVENRSLDCMLNGIIPDLNAFVCIPPLVVVENRHEDSLSRQ
jgi:GR25 family glycosyltransferase involved in LPS biosynthesis/tetratricopeptide (TPR) repeat protein